jgi:hypothetical protein
MMPSPAYRDDQAAPVENASFRWAYLVMSFGLLGLVAYRSFFWRESPWDLLALVVLGGGVSAAYQGYYGVLTVRRGVLMAVGAVVAALVAALMATIR